MQTVDWVEWETPNWIKVKSFIVTRDGQYVWFKTRLIRTLQSNI